MSLVKLIEQTYFWFLYGRIMERWVYKEWNDSCNISSNCGKELASVYKEHDILNPRVQHYDVMRYLTCIVFFVLNIDMSLVVVATPAHLLVTSISIAEENII